MAVDPIQYAINRAYPFVEEQQQALDEGRISENALYWTPPVPFDYCASPSWAMCRATAGGSSWIACSGAMALPAGA